jgi:hypothetical protein
MQQYCEAIEECRTIPALSLLPLGRLYFQIILWEMGAGLSLLLLPFDLVLSLVRRVFGRRKGLLGMAVYSYALRPLRSVWRGEVSAIAVIRSRYVTRLLLFYYTQSRINALQSAFNRRHLDLLFNDVSNSAALHAAEEFQKSFDLFRKITAGSYQLGALAVGGPLVALISLVLQKALIPTAIFVWGYFNSSELHPLSETLRGSLITFLIIFGVCAVWIVVAGWMDMREILTRLNVREIERDVSECAGIEVRREVPYDVLFYFCATGSVIWGFHSFFAYQLERMGSSAAFERQLDSMRIQSVVMLGILVALGLVALSRRVWLSRQSVDMRTPSS